ncbi:hypothetical protein CC78DRAFT_564826 [Lojkania enalia]|uniref:Chromatin assembly factor 1 subunit A n=1 Tax=Lojkania enalia TaxID=147567 RepID=A0A9P4NAF1_9PLEO|nr:hypothetical protein CC78DRAFT_564826 [Didymosphaeria enalia]
MEDPPVMTLVAPQKRPHEDAVAVPLSTPTKPPASEPSTPLTDLSTLQTPPSLKKTLSQSLAPASSNNSVAGDAQAPTQTVTESAFGQQPVKRRKLTVQEKENKRLEKEAKEKAKAEHKAQKEEEKRLKDEEKRKKNEEREEKKRAKELEQQQREQEKRKKEEAKQKKDRNQMRLGAFFGKKSGGETSGNSTIATTDNIIPESISSSSHVPLPNVNPGPSSPQKVTRQTAQSDYERFFLPFQLPSRATLAPYNRFAEDLAAVASATSRLDQLISGQASKGPIDRDSLKARFPASRPRGLDTPSIAEIVGRLNRSSGNPTDLTDDRGVDAPDPLNILKEIPMKYLHFGEDVRPPYYGTYTKPYSIHQALKLSRCPFSRNLEEVNYDYDSEAEWEEPEEGEDLDSDGEDDLDEDAEDDMEGFLDDEDDPQVKRRLISGDLEPISTGLCWEDARGVSRLNDGSEAISTEFGEFKMGFLLETQTHSIDPFSTTYWAPEPIPVTAPTASTRETAINRLMNPPRLPLTQRPINGMLNAPTSSEKAYAAATSKAAKSLKRQIPEDQLPAFKAAVEGSDMTKIALIESLKKQFPKLPKDAIGNTLSTVATRVGAKEADKRWVLL